jgi:pyrimidine-specific ribonucleoside hydrolase
MRELIIADNVHGESGLDGPALPEPGFAPQNVHRRRADGQNAARKPEPVTMVATGPQTNVALLLNSHPELHAKIARIVIMGGAMVLGNWQPAAEFNIYVDPEAAEIVFQSGIPVVMAGLDVTHKAQIHVEDIERFRHWQPGIHHRRRTARLLYEYHKDEKWGFVGAPLHDPCTIAWLLKPEMFTTVERWVGVETREIYPGDDGGRLLQSDRQSAQYHGDAGWTAKPLSICSPSGWRFTPASSRWLFRGSSENRREPPGKSSRRRGSPLYRSSRPSAGRSAPAAPSRPSTSCSRYLIFPSCTQRPISCWNSAIRCP